MPVWTWESLRKAMDDDDTKEAELTESIKTLSAGIDELDQRNEETMKEQKLQMERLEESYIRLIEREEIKERCMGTRQFI
jgi:uncharacterized protein YdcH (DUF465 family)